MFVFPFVIDSIYECLLEVNVCLVHEYYIQLKMPLYPNQIKNNILSSGDYNGRYYLERPKGSFYLQMKHWFDYYLALYSDWNWLVNFRTKETFAASEFENFSQR